MAGRHDLIAIVRVKTNEAMADLVTTEFKTNGGSSIKDAVVQTLEWQRAHDVQHAEAKRPAAQSVPARRRTRVVKD